MFTFTASANSPLPRHMVSRHNTDVLHRSVSLARGRLVAIRIALLDWWPLLLPLPEKPSTSAQTVE